LDTARPRPAGRFLQLVDEARRHVVDLVEHRRHGQDRQYGRLFPRHGHSGLQDFFGERRIIQGHEDLHGGTSQF
jgi:hypothetical protein